MVEQSVTKIFLANSEALREEYVDGFGLSEAEFDIVRSLSSRGGRTFLVKQGDSSAICELDLTGLEDFVAVLSATTDNVALLDAIRDRVGDDPDAWLPRFLEAVKERRNAQRGQEHAEDHLDFDEWVVGPMWERFTRAIRQGK
jgi:type IV secretion system protein VirB4